MCGDDEEVHMSDKDKLLLEVNKAIRDNLKALEQEPFMNKACISSKVCKHDKEVVLDKISAEIEEEQTYDGIYIDRAYVLEIIDKYKAESEDK